MVGSGGARRVTDGGVDDGLQHRLAGLLGGVGELAAAQRQAVSLEQGLRLVLVEAHLEGSDVFP